MRAFKSEISILSLAAALCAVGAPSAAYAQADASGNQAAPDDQDASEQESGNLNQIVVTAQFVEQNVQTTPISITAISGEMLEARGQISVSDLAGTSPNVQLQTGGAFTGPSLVAFIRGVGQTDFNPALEPGVALYVDDVYYSTLTGSQLDLFDLDRVEVLRGPQGTLSGKNAIGGAIRLFSQRPSEDPNGYLEVTGGSFDALKIRGATNITLAEEQLWLRVSAVSNYRNGHVRSIDYACANPGSGFATQRTTSDCEIGREGGVRYQAARVALRWLPSDNVEINLDGSIVNDDSQPAANTLLAVGRTRAPVTLPTGQSFDTRGAVQGSGCLFIAFGPNSCNPNSPNDPYINYSTYSNPTSGLVIPRKQGITSQTFSLGIDWDVSDALQIQSISAYRSFDAGFGSDNDGTPFPVTLAFQGFDHTQVSQEIRVNGEMSDTINWTVGGYYFNADSTIDSRINIEYAALDFVGGSDTESSTYAVFANAIANITSYLTVIAGARYTHDEKSVFLRRAIAGVPVPIFDAINAATPDFVDKRIDYRVAISYEVAEDTMVYGSMASGFKGGGVNPRPFNPQQAAVFGSETLITYEIGVKSDLLDRTLRLNVSAFYNKYSDVQLTFNNCVAQFGPVNGAPCFLPANAGDATVQGLELEMEWAPTRNLSIDGSFSYLDFQFDTVRPFTVALTAKPPYTPKTSWNIGGQYTVQTPLGNFTPRVDLSYRGDMFTAPDNSALGIIDAVTLLNASVRFVPDADREWSLTIEGRNLTDQLYFQERRDVLASTGTAYASPALPRTFNATLRYRF